MIVHGRLRFAHMQERFSATACDRHFRAGFAAFETLRDDLQARDEVRAYRRSHTVNSCRRDDLTCPQSPKVRDETKAERAADAPCNIMLPQSGYVG